MTELDITPDALVFDRTPVARIISIAAVLGSASLVFDHLSGGRDAIHPLGLTALVLLFIGTVFSALLQYGDHIYLTREGLVYQNRLFPLMARKGSAMRWDEVIEVREIRQKILVLFSRDGRRILVDSITGYAIARNEILKRTPHATLSGTLTRGTE